MDNGKKTIQNDDSGEIEPPLFTYGAHWRIFIPTIIICILYFICWLTLFFMGKSDSALARLFIVVLALGVPLLLAHAFLRYQTISIDIFKSHIHYQPGWPRSKPVILPYEQLEKFEISKGFSGRIFGGGTVIIKLARGQTVAIGDMEKPDKILEHITALL